MTELPSAQAANLGLGPRKFRLRDGPDMSDRSCWTDTPAQKAQKQMDLVNIKNMLLCICFKLQMRGIPFLLELKNFIYVLMCYAYRILFRKQKDSGNQKRNM